MFQIGHVSLTSADTYRRDSYCLAQVFQNLPAPSKQYGVFDVFRDFQSFFQLENLGSHLAMCPDDRFLPQGKQILPEISQVRLSSRSMMINQLSSDIRPYDSHPRSTFT